MTAGLVLRDGRALLVHNAKHGDVRIEPPGGKVNPGEGLKESVVRELREELGIEVRVGRLFGAYHTTSPEGDFLVRTYLCEIASGEPRVCEPDKVPDFGWYDLKEMEDLARKGSLVPNMVAALKDLKVFLS